MSSILLRCFMSLKTRPHQGGTKAKGDAVIELAKRVQRWRAAGKTVAMAFVLRTADSSPRGIGSTMAVSSDGDIAGSVSAGCAESVIIREAFEVMASGKQKKVTLSSADATLDVAAPCGGDLEVLIQPYDDELHGFVMQCVFAGTPFVYMAAVDDDGPLASSAAVVSETGSACAWMDDAAMTDVLERVGWNPGKRRAQSPYEGERSNPAVPFGGVSAGVFAVMGSEMFACRYEVRPKIVCVGAVHIAACLAPMAEAAGYDVCVIDPRKAFLDKGRFPESTRLVHGWPQAVFPSMGIDSGCAVCVLTHDEKIDVAALCEALKTDAFYIGCLGSPKTLRSRVASLIEEGASADEFGRIHGPIGLYIGGKNPGDIAVSILAQIQAVRFGRIGFGLEMPGHTLDDFSEANSKRGIA